MGSLLNPQDRSANLPSVAKVAAPRQRNSILYWLIAALLVVAILPFALAAYQSWMARESMVDQAQRTHLISARASADRVAGFLQGGIQLAEAAAANPQLFEDPKSQSAQEILTGILVSRANVLAAATFYRQGDDDLMVQLARPQQSVWADEKLLKSATSTPSLIQTPAGLAMLVARDSSRENLRVVVVISAALLNDFMQPMELGPSATLGLFNSATGELLFAQRDAIPQTLFEYTQTSPLGAGATRVEKGGATIVAGFARVTGTQWTVLSVQAAQEAEIAAAQMRVASSIAFAAVLIVVALLSLLAWRYVLGPVRELLHLQRSVLGGEHSQRGDLAELRASFGKLQNYHRSKDALDRVFVDRYQVMHLLGQGAMGAVFQAWDPRLRRFVAIKTIHLDNIDASRKLMLQRSLENEAVAVAALNHPCLVAIYDLVAEADVAFVVMELVEGENLRTLIRREGALSAGETAYIGAQLLKGLAAAHAAGVLHRDIKPANILLSNKVETKLTDFGVATRRSELSDKIDTESIVGTPGYIAPECAAGSAASERSDLFAIGVSLLECISGQQFYRASNAAEVLRLTLVKPVEVAADIYQQAPQLAEIIAKLCHANPAKRPALAKDIAQQLDQLVDDGAIARLQGRVLQRRDGSPDVTNPSDMPTRSNTET